MENNTIDVEEFNKIKQMVHTIAENQTKLMKQITDVRKELKQTIDLLSATNEDLRLHEDIKKLLNSDLNAS